MTPTRYRIVCRRPACASVRGRLQRSTTPLPGDRFFACRVGARQLPHPRVRAAFRHGARLSPEARRSRVTKSIEGRVADSDPCAGPLTLVAQVYAFDPSVRAAYLDGTRGFFNGPAVFVWPVGHERRPCTLEIVAPGGASRRPMARGDEHAARRGRPVWLRHVSRRRTTMSWSTIRSRWATFDLRAFRRGRRAPRHRGHRPASRLTSNASRRRYAAHLPGADRLVRRCAVEPRASRPLRVPAPVHSPMATAASSTARAPASLSRSSNGLLPLGAPSPRSSSASRRRLSRSLLSDW